MSFLLKDEEFFDKLTALQTKLASHSADICGDAPSWFIDSFLGPLNHWIGENSPSARTDKPYSLAVETDDWFRGAGRAMSETISDARCFNALERFRSFVGVRTAAEIIAEAEGDSDAPSSP
jgi:hypothetical protein